MNLKGKITGLITALFILAANTVFLSASAETLPGAEIGFEPYRTADGIMYDVYVENASFLSTLIFEMKFDADEKGSLSLADNECFDVSYSQWESGDGVSLKGYLGRTGQKSGFSSADKIKVAEIFIPEDAAKTGVVTAAVSSAKCAGVVKTDEAAVRGSVSVKEKEISYKIRECSVLNFGASGADILAASDCTADIICAAYDEDGNLLNAVKESAKLKQGENKIDITGQADGAKTVSIMVWDSGTMRPMAEKVTVNN